MLRVLMAATAVALVGGSMPAQASSIGLGPLTFAAQTAGVEIIDGTGDGSQANPFVIFENLSGPDEILAIRGLLGSGLSEVGTFATGFWITKVVTNLTGFEWFAFDLELQQELGVPSPDGDGLSFAQGFAGARPFTSSVFTNVSEISDVRDQITFTGGIVLPGDTVSFSFAVTDNSPVAEFYLRQRPNFVDSVIPLPGALPLLLSALGGLAFLRRRGTVAS